MKCILPARKDGAAHNISLKGSVQAGVKVVFYSFLAVNARTV